MTIVIDLRRMSICQRARAMWCILRCKPFTITDVELDE